MSAHWHDEYQLVRAFDCGADDVLAKGQSPLELMARVRAVLLLSTVRRQLADARREVEELEGVLAVCAACKRVRDEGPDWVDMEAYVRRLSGREITHGVCPECRERLYGRPGTS
jgi:DNA-binding response OmpR family regulator